LKDVLERVRPPRRFLNQRQLTPDQRYWALTR
jgi:hypothetical protein